MNYRNLRIVIAFAIGVPWLNSGDAEAGFKISVSDGINTTIIGDNSAGDNRSASGLIGYSNGDLVFTAGISKPLLGGPNEPVMHLSALRWTTPVSSALTIEITDTDFTGAPGGLDPATFLSSIGGVTMGHVSFKTFVDSTNAEFGKAQQLGPGFEYSNNSWLRPAFSGEWSTLANVASTPFSLTMQATIRHPNAFSATSFDAQLQAVPEPTTALMWLAAVPFAAVLAVRRRSRNRNLAVSTF